MALSAGDNGIASSGLLGAKERMKAFIKSVAWPLELPTPLLCALGAACQHASAAVRGTKEPDGQASRQNRSYEV